MDKKKLLHKLINIRLTLTLQLLKIESKDYLLILEQWITKCSRHRTAPHISEILRMIRILKLEQNKYKKQ